MEANVSHRKSLQSLYSADDAVSKVIEATFGSPLVNNVLRGLLAEAIIALAIEPEWEWCSGDYSSWDFQNRASGARLEVKQSAAKQSWVLNPSSRPSAPRFDIAPRTGRWETDGSFVAEAGRAAQLYIFAYHPVADESADHREPHQWHFYVTPTANLPSTKSIGLRSLEELSVKCGITGLARAVNAAEEGLVRASSTSA